MSINNDDLNLSQNSATSKISPFTSCPKWMLICLKTQKNDDFKDYKVAHNLLLGDIEIL